MQGYYTVNEYAAIMNKDSSNIRKLLINGKIHGEKLGRQWIIPKDTVYPTDNRVKSGDYRNWRDAVKINQKNSQLMRALKNMCKELSSLYGKTLEKIVLYGSYARGEESEESDVDIALILKNESNESQHDQMLDIVVNYELMLDHVLSVVPIESEQFHEWKNTLPFYKNVDKEGVTLWKQN